MSMTTSIRQIGGVTIVDIRGRMVLGKESALVRDLIYDLLRNGHKQIVLNLGAVDYIDTTGVGLLVGSYTTVRKRGGEMILLDLQEKVAAVMQTSNLHKVFETANGEAAAIASFGHLTLKLRAGR
jgi:anti-sigma B factor antagonist